MNIRPYRESDRETLKAITVEAFASVAIEHNIEQAFGTIAGHDWQWRKARQIDEDCTAPGAAIWVAEDERGEIVGYVTTRLDHEAGIGLIPNLAVKERLRGQGLGRQLIEYALERFRAAGLELARIETLDQNPIGQHLYPVCGFVEVARQVHYAMRLQLKDSPQS
jgi:ribosomal protein S18 acetylase RimI-like enzyme